MNIVKQEIQKFLLRASVARNFCWASLSEKGTVR